MDAGGMTLHDILDLACNRDTAANTLWTVYIAVIAGIGTVLASDRPLLRKRIARLVLIILFGIFAFINGSAIWNALHQRAIFLSMLPGSTADNLRSAFSTVTLPQLIWFHGQFDLAVLLAVWFLPTYRTSVRQTAAST